MHFLNNQVAQLIFHKLVKFINCVLLNLFPISGSLLFTCTHYTVLICLPTNSILLWLFARAGTTILSMAGDITLDQVKTDPMYDLKLLMESENNDELYASDSPYQHCSNDCKYHEPHTVATEAAKINNPVSYFHLNCRGLSANW